MQFTIDDLKRTMRACAGEDDSAGLGGDILDVRFEDLGYDSLALLETTSRVSREFDVKLPEDEMAAVCTPRELVSFVNEQLKAKA
jgi:minimal PKS acyl carrier protein